MENRCNLDLTVRELSAYLVTGMFRITVIYWVSDNMYEEDITVNALVRDFSKYGISYITIQHGRMIIGLNNPAR